MKSFEELGLAPAVVRVLAKREITTPTPIQAQVYEAASAGKDVLAKSRTGSGKTLAFGLPILTRLDSKNVGAQMLVLTPTRELAVQVAKELEDVANAQKLSVTAIIGGASMRDQIRSLRSAHVVIGTPGRIIDHIDRGTLSLDNARAIVLDEGDEMLDMGFLEDMTKILEAFPAEGQRLLFSATVPPQMKKVIANYLREPVRIETENAKTAHADISHVFYRVRAQDRYSALANVLLYEPMNRVLVFTQTKQETQDLALRLNQDGFTASFINGDLSQDQRTQVMDAFRSGRTALLIATDVAARGIDVKDVSHVVHYTLPGSFASYVHRSGRTGRAGATGTSLAFVGASEYYKAQRITKEGNLTAKWETPPTPEMIAGARIQRLKLELEEKLATPASKRSLKLAETLLAENEPAALVATLLDSLQSGQPGGYEIASPDAPKAKRADRDFGASDRRERKPFGRGEARESDDRKPWVKEGPARKFGKERRGPREREAGMDRYRIAIGNRHRLNPAFLIQTLCRLNGLKGGDFGHIDIQPNFTVFDVRSTVAGKLKKRPVLPYDGKEVPIKPFV
jgi:ATP-dependent RNA helicase DeaD